MQFFFSTEPVGGLQCHVGFSYGYEDRTKTKYSSELSVPPKLMDCRTWHDEQMKGKSKMIKVLKEQSKKTENPVVKAFILTSIVLLENLKPCKDDCLFCGTEIDDGSDWVFKKTCLGPNDMKKGIPKDDCKTFTLEDLTDFAGNRQFSRSNMNNQEMSTKICTCSTNGCNNYPPNETPSKEKQYQDDGNGTTNPSILKHLLIVSSFFVVRTYY